MNRWSEYFFSGLLQNISQNIRCLKTPKLLYLTFMHESSLSIGGLVKANLNYVFTTLVRDILYTCNSYRQSRKKFSLEIGSVIFCYKTRRMWNKYSASAYFLSFLAKHHTSEKVMTDFYDIYHSSHLYQSKKGKTHFIWNFPFLIWNTRSTYTICSDFWRCVIHLNFHETSYFCWKLFDI